MTRHSSRILSRVAAGVIAIGLAACGATRMQPPPETTEDGLSLAAIKGIDIAYVRPGASLARYQRLLLDPVDVTFSKDWDPERTGSRMKLTEREREKIRSNLAQLFESTFREELESKGGYSVVDRAASDVLRVTASLADVYLNAPDVMTPGRTRTYVMSAGRMTLVAELRDSETGVLLARIADERLAREDGFLKLSSSVETSAEARAMITNWARILRARLDVVKVQGGPELR